LTVRAVLFDVDFTLAKPGPLLGPEGYRESGRQRAAAIEDLRHHPELEHDEEIWVRFTEDIVRGMGGDGDACRIVAEAITERWLHSENFELYEDVLPVMAHLREHGLKVALVSNTSRDLDAFVRHFSLDVDAWITSRSHGKVKPSPSIFKAILEELEVEPEEAVMVGDSAEDDVAGARALGIKAFLVNRDGLSNGDALPTLLALPALIGLPATDA
jgi:HAD superfamily hydrolase (TIGR01662 family)